MASALATAHEAGVLHRDVKPGNAVLRPNGEVVLVDFGIARSSRAGTMATHEGLILGTPEYMAPELFLGMKSSPASDQYALAATLVHLATGSPPLGKISLSQRFQAAQARVEVSVPGTLGRVTGILQRALASDPGFRYAGLDEFPSALAEGLTPQITATKSSAATVVVHEGAPVAANGGSSVPLAGEAARPGWSQGRLGLLFFLFLILGSAFVPWQNEPRPVSPSTNWTLDGPRDESSTAVAWSRLQDASEALRQGHLRAGRSARLPEDGSYHPQDVLVPGHTAEHFEWVLKSSNIQPMREWSEAYAAWVRSLPQAERSSDPVWLAGAGGRAAFAHLLSDLLWAWKNIRSSGLPATDVSPRQVRRAVWLQFHSLAEIAGDTKDRWGEPAAEEVPHEVWIRGYLLLGSAVIGARERAKLVEWDQPVPKISVVIDGLLAQIVKSPEARSSSDLAELGSLLLRQTNTEDINDPLLIRWIAGLVRLEGVGSSATERVFSLRSGIRAAVAFPTRFLGIATPELGPHVCRAAALIEAEAARSGVQVSQIRQGDKPIRKRVALTLEKAPGWECLADLSPDLVWRKPD